METENLAALSDQLLVVTLIGYAIAMVAYAAEYAFGAKPAKKEALVTVGGSSEASSETTLESTEDAAEDAQRPNASRAARAESLGRLAVVVTILAALAHTGSVLARAAATERVPWGDMYEFISMLCVASVWVWLMFVYKRPELRHLGIFLLLPVTLLLGLAGTVLYTDPGPLAPALDSYWLKIHVSTAAISSGVFLVGFVTAVLFWVRAGWEKRESAGKTIRFPFTLGSRLPGSEALDQLTFRVHALAFPLWTFAIIAGAIWAEAAWTRAWGWDPKETWAFISWVIYAAYLHARTTAGWRGSKAMGIAVAGWASMMINLFAVNLIYSGLHSYAGIS